MHISGDIVSELMGIEGECRGTLFQEDARYIRRVEGESGLNALQEETKRNGYYIDYKNIKPMAMYPVGLRVLSLLTARVLFNWDDARIIDMGRNAPKHSLLKRLVSRFYFSIDRLAKAAPEYWRIHWNIGSLETVELDKDKKCGILRLYNFKLDSINCKHLSGYFSGAVEMLGVKNVRTEETKCMHKGDDYHEFIIKWD